MQRSEHSAPVIAGALLATGVLLVPVVASAAPTSPSAPATTFALAGDVAAHHHVSRVRVGKRYIFVARGMRGVRRGDRLGLRVKLVTPRDHDNAPSRFHEAGKYRLRRGQHRFRGRVRAAAEGLYDLQLFLVRHHHVVRHSFSNTWRVRVIPHKAKHRKPGAPNAGPDLLHSDPAAASAAIPVSNWTNVGCGGEGFPGNRDGQYTHVDMTPPFTTYQGSAMIEEVTWSRDLPRGGTQWSGWYQLGTWQFTVYPDRPTITPILDPANYFSTESFEQYIMEYGSAYDYAHQLAWDFMVSFDQGVTWQWYSNQWYTPGSYSQVADPAGPNAGSVYPSDYCWSWDNVAP